MTAVAQQNKSNFLLALQDGETVAGAARKLQRPRRYFYNLAIRDPQFKAAWQAAIANTVEHRATLMKERSHDEERAKPKYGKSPVGGKRTPHYRKLALDALARGCSITKASEIADISYVVLQRWRKRDPEFAADWDIAVQMGIDRLEDEAFRRAVEGVARNIYNKNGDVTGVVREYSDQLLALMLKAKINAYRRTEQSTLNVDASTNVKIDMTYRSADELRRELELRGISMETVKRLTHQPLEKADDK